MKQTLSNAEKRFDAEAGAAKEIFQNVSNKTPPVQNANRFKAYITQKPPGLKNSIISRFLELLFLFVYIFTISSNFPNFSLFSSLVFYFILVLFSYIFGEFESDAHPHFGLNLRIQFVFLATIAAYSLLSLGFHFSSLSVRFLIYCWIYLSLLAPIIGLGLRRLSPAPAVLVTDQKKKFGILKWWGFDCQETIKKDFLMNWLKSSSDNLGRVTKYQTILVDITNPHIGEAVVKFSENYFTNFYGIKSFKIMPYLLSNHSRNLNCYPGFGINYRLKRLLDIIISLLILIIISPIFLLIVICIKLDSPGPVFYKHKRLGRNMKNFFLLKFRTMHQDADKRLEAILAKNPELKKEFETTFKLKNDPRVTRVGRFLRPYSLDEFPQIFNILRGEMSWVGPRPIVVEEVPFYKDYSLLMFRVLPGATGLWQISGRCDTRYQKRVELDTLYAKNWSFLNDLKILVKTFPAVLSKRGAY
jgi:lipopolysaccharide/colanic/teichoic acid biosynthesis glycosyltransferase